MNRKVDNKIETKLSHINSIRGIAILMVILTHVSQTVKELDTISATIASYGQMGVQLFFVVSAYTLCLSADNRIHESHALKKYAIRRFFRIAPLFYIGLLYYFIIEALRGWYYTNALAWPINFSPVNVLFNIFFLHGFYEPANNTIVPGGWSIGTEMGFYALFPVFFYCIKRNQLVNPKTFLLLIISIQLVVISILFFIQSYSRFSIENNSFLYFSIINQLPVFCIGIGYYFTERWAIFNRHWLFDMTIFVLLTCISQYLWHKKQPFLFTVIPSTCALSFVFLINMFKKVRWLNFRILVKIGILSYSMYIFHIIFAFKLSTIISSQLKHKINSNYNLFVLIALYAMSIIGTYLIAILSDKYIERPFIKKGKRIIEKIDTPPKVSMHQ